MPTSETVKKKLHRYRCNSTAAIVLRTIIGSISKNMSAYECMRAGRVSTLALQHIFIFHLLLGVIIKKSTNLYPFKVHCDYLFTLTKIIFITEKHKINLELKINKVKSISVISILVVVEIDMIQFIFDRKNRITYEKIRGRLNKEIEDLFAGRIQQTK